MQLNSAWLKFKDAELQLRILKKLQELKVFEDQVPCIITIYDAADFSLLYMSETGTRLLGVSLEELTDMYRDHSARFFNPDDIEEYIPKMNALMQRNDASEIISFFQQIRFSPEHDWVWYLSATKIFLQNQHGQPLLLVTISLPVDPKSHVNRKVERLIRENDFLKNNQHLFVQLTKREKEILKYLAQGYTPKEISGKVFLSETTVVTHKRNIRSKLKIQSPVDLLKFAQAFDLL